MEPWLMPGTSYNRPICRRIVEEAGIPRHMFGLRKAATDLIAYEETKFLSDDLMEDYLDWLKANRGDWYKRLRLPPWRNRQADDWLNSLSVRSARAVNRAAIRARDFSNYVPILRRINFHPLIAMSPRLINLRQYCFPWAVDRTVRRYEPIVLADEHVAAT
jgi:hypothetical protein